MEIYEFAIECVADICGSIVFAVIVLRPFGACFAWFSKVNSNGLCPPTAWVYRLAAWSNAPEPLIIGVVAFSSCLAVASMDILLSWLKLKVLFICSMLPWFKFPSFGLSVVSADDMKCCLLDVWSIIWTCGSRLLVIMIRDLWLGLVLSLSQVPLSSFDVTASRNWCFEPRNELWSSSPPAYDEFPKCWPGYGVCELKCLILFPAIKLQDANAVSKLGRVAAISGL